MGNRIRISVMLLKHHIIVSLLDASVEMYIFAVPFPGFYALNTEY